MRRGIYGVALANESRSSVKLYQLADFGSFNRVDKIISQRADVSRILVYMSSSSLLNRIRRIRSIFIGVNPGEFASHVTRFRV